MVATHHRPHLATLEGLDWNDLPAVAEACRQAYEQLTSDRWRGVVDLLQQLPTRPELVQMCESYDFLDKLVLHDDLDHNYRLRLHRFRPGYFDRPHNHRWSFGSLILTGSYRHVQYGSDTDFENTGVQDLRPLQVRTERAGDVYVLHHTAVHSVAADDGTVSLVIRGPAAKSRFRILDATNDRAFHVTGAAEETSDQREAKRMTAERLGETIRDVLRTRPPVDL